MNLIGATADDARDIMIEGESGILAICPGPERPRYLPSKRGLGLGRAIFPPVLKLIPLAISILIAAAPELGTAGFVIFADVVNRKCARN